MAQVSEDVTLTLPRSAVPGVVALSARLTDRMHDLLERGTDGSLTPAEREQLETLVEMSQFGQIVTMALQARAQP